MSAPAAVHLDRSAAGAFDDFNRDFFVDIAVESEQRADQRTDQEQDDAQMDPGDRQTGPAAFFAENSKPALDVFGPGPAKAPFEIGFIAGFQRFRIFGRGKDDAPLLFHVFPCNAGPPHPRIVRRRRSPGD